MCVCFLSEEFIVERAYRNNSDRPEGDNYEPSHLNSRGILRGRAGGCESCRNTVVFVGDWVGYFDNTRAAGWNMMMNLAALTRTVERE